MRLRKYIAKTLVALVAVVAVAPLNSCSDEPDSKYFYTFTGEMMSDYLRNRPQYSDFTTIVERANLMDRLSTYGKYTCFVPSNDAMATYLQSKGMQSIDQLTDADCDTIARTHLVGGNMFSTYDMNQDRLNSANMLGRYIGTSSGVDEDGNAIIILEGSSRIYFATQNDSVENGLVHPIDKVIEKSNSYVADIMRENTRLGIFYEALVATGVYENIQLVEDTTWHKDAHKKYYYKSHTWPEVAWAPDTKKYGFTLFVEPDSLYRAKFAELGISTDNGNLRALYDLACRYYDETYPEDVAAAGHSFENLTDSVNPLKRFVQYHILNRYVAGTADLTPKVMDKTGEAFGINTSLVNPVDWYPTLLPHTMLKIEQLTMNNYRGGDPEKERYINRRYDATAQIHGALIDSSVDTTFTHDGINGHLFYVNDLVVFSRQVIDVVQNMRIRMDFSAIFPEVMTNDMRLQGDPYKDDTDASGNAIVDDSSIPANGFNRYFPMGYLDGVTYTETEDTKLVLRRPHTNFWSWQGDEWNLFGDYDLTFRIPPVPYSGEWQLRLGFCALETRGVMQVYFDGVPQGIPLDMTKYLDSDLYLGKNRFANDETLEDYNKKTDEEKAEEQKLLKNLGAYRDGRSQYHFRADNGTKYYFLGNPRTYRRVLCQTYIDATKDHFLRFRVASDGTLGNNNEFMLDFFEMVPKSVYGVDGTGEMEDDL